MEKTSMVGLNSIRYQAGILTVIVALILITPLCGFLFDCGCTWPWAGLESHCNIHNPNAVHQCPWCVSTIAGTGSVGLAVLIGFLLSVKPSGSGYDVRDSALAGIQQKASASDFIQRAVIGLLGFTIAAVITAWLSGYVLEYPYFVFISGWPL
ncbi:MAG TPA: hypothetical protein EYG50_10745 [Cycloclasticus sp.]|jgi:hypothetical protein|nr:hypothetical protein [Cycloclasticus sp.]HIL93191.1 hypothetical protein [Cycloclasticus sp.]